MPNKGDIVVRTEYLYALKDKLEHQEGALIKCTENGIYACYSMTQATDKFRPATDEEKTWFHRGMRNINETRFKVGDKVQIGKVDKGWEDYVDELEEFIGKQGAVSSIHHDSICVDAHYNFPNYALEKIPAEATEPINPDWINHFSVKVGGEFSRYVDFARGNGLQVNQFWGGTGTWYGLSNGRAVGSIEPWGKEFQSVEEFINEFNAAMNIKKEEDFIWNIPMETILSLTK